MIHKKKEGGEVMRAEFAAQFLTEKAASEAVEALDKVLEVVLFCTVADLLDREVLDSAHVVWELSKRFRSFTVLPGKGEHVQ